MELNNVKHRIDMWRYYDELQNIFKKEPKDNCTLFYGSSTFAHYVKIEDDFKEYNAINCGFGGSTSDEALFHYENIVGKLKPNILVFYNGDNEPVCGYSLKETQKFYKAIFKKYHEDFPNGFIIIVGTKSSYARKEYYDFVVKLNKFEKKLAEEYDYIEYVDTRDIWFDDEKNDYKYENFCDGKLHYNDKGNELFASRIKEIIENRRKLNIVNEPILHEAKRFLKVLICYTAVFSLIFLSVVMSILFGSNNDYIINLISNIVFSIIYGFYLVFMTRELIYRQKKKINLYSLMQNADLYKEYLIYDDMVKNYLHEGVYVHLLKFKTKDGQDRDVLSLREYPLNLVKGVEYTITTACNVVVEVKTNA